ncbi:MAG TPA: hypothetical protein VIS31_05160 [Woeseiaceae bacterium]
MRQVFALSVLSLNLAATPALCAEEPAGPAAVPRMSEGLRTSLKNIVVLPGQAPAGQSVTGSYEKDTLGLAGGMQVGTGIGNGVGMDVGGIPVNIPFPILTLPGAILGGIAGLTEKEIQDFRDGLTKDLARAASQPLSNQSLASDVFWGLRRLGGIEPKVLAPEAAVPEGTDAVIYVSMRGVTIDAQGNDAVITTGARVTVRRQSDGADIYSHDVSYEDRDELTAWARDDYALWHDYGNFARHYLGREIIAMTYGRIELGLDVQPAKSGDVSLARKNPWQGTTKSLTPTIAWALAAEAQRDEDTAIAWDLEIYDSHRPVYKVMDLEATSHTLDIELEACKTYRWSVRPVYRLGSETRFGEWMRSNPGGMSGNGNVGSKASESPAYTQGFASLAVKCGR